MKEAQAWFYLHGGVVSKGTILLDRGAFFTKILDFRNRHLQRIPFHGRRAPDGHVYFSTKAPGYQDSFVVEPSWRGAIYTSPGLTGQIGLSVREFRPCVRQNMEYWRIFTREEGLLIVAAYRKNRAVLWAEQRGFVRPIVEPATWHDVQTWRLGAEPLNLEI